LVKNTENPENNPRYPERIKRSQALRAFYDNFGENEELAIAIDNAVRKSKEEDFRNNEFKMRKIKASLAEVFDNDEDIQKAVEIIIEQEEY
jgi:type I restriction enzyme R subunit